MSQEEPRNYEGLVSCQRAEEHSRTYNSQQRMLSLELFGEIFSGSCSRSRRREPLTFAAPLPRGVVATPEELQIVDAEGEVLATQARALDRWADGSVRWALIDILADVDASHRAWRLQRRVGGDIPVTDLRLEIADDGRVSVRTGAADFDIAGAGTFPFSRVVTGGIDHYDANRSGLDDRRSRGTSLEAGDCRHRDRRTRTVACVGQTRRHALEWRRDRGPRHAAPALLRGIGRRSIRAHPQKSAPGRASQWVLGSWRPRVDPASRSGLQAGHHSRGRSVPLVRNRSTTRARRRRVRAPSVLERWRQLEEPGSRDGRGDHATPCPEGIDCARAPEKSRPIAPRQSWPFGLPERSSRSPCRTSGRTFRKRSTRDERSLVLRLWPRQYASSHELQGGEQKTHVFCISVGREASEIEMRLIGVASRRPLTPTRRGTARRQRCPI